jgi:hypothetical protein
MYVSAFVFDHTRGVGRINLFRPIPGALIGLLPVYKKTSYRNPPKAQPRKQATSGT